MMLIEHCHGEHINRVHDIIKLSSLGRGFAGKMVTASH